MARASKNKLLEKLLRVTGNFRWAEMVTLLKHLGYDYIDGREGSRVAFHNSEKDLLISVIHKPHPGNNVKKPYQRKVNKHLKNNGVIK